MLSHAGICQPKHKPDMHWFTWHCCSAVVVILLGIFVTFNFSSHLVPLFNTFDGNDNVQPSIDFNNLPKCPPQN